MKLKVLKRPAAALPPLYASWVDGLLGGPIPAETGATCDDCAMCNSSRNSPGDNSLFFNPRTKCCTYLPWLANFLVGRVLADDLSILDDAAAHGRRTVEKRIDEGNAVSPLAVGIPKNYTLVYQHNRDYFGHADQMRCPHYVEEGGRCGVWRHRNSVCATWFCKHVRGAVGQQFWRTLLQLLRMVERQLAVWCVLELDPGAAALTALLDPMRMEVENHGLSDLTRSSPRYADAWGRWLGKEREFYRQCAKLVNPLSWREVMRLCGQEVRAFAAQTREAYRRLLSDEMPDSLSVGKLDVVGLGNESVRLCSYIGTDPVELPRELFDALSQFNGRPRKDAMNSIAERHGLELDDELLRGLVDFKVLVPATAAPATVA